MPGRRLPAQFGGGNSVRITKQSAYSHTDYSSTVRVKLTIGCLHRSAKEFNNFQVSHTFWDVWNKKMWPFCILLLIFFFFIVRNNENCHVTVDSQMSQSTSTHCISNSCSILDTVPVGKIPSFIKLRWTNLLPNLFSLLHLFYLHRAMRKICQ